MASSPAYPSTLWLPPGNPLAVEDTYETPNGFRDFPFMYVYDASRLINGLNYLSQRVLMDGSADFILRFIWGFSQILNQVAINPGGGLAKFQFKNHWGSYCSSAPMIMAAGPNAVISPALGGVLPTLKNPDTWQVVPEKRYPLDSQISFDLYNIFLSAATANAHVLGFTGVKRRPQGFCFYETPYKYKEMPYSYNADFVLNTAATDATGSPTPPTQLQINIADYDFELQRILMCPDSIETTSNFNFSMVLYDNGGEPTSNRPVPITYMIDNGLGEGGSGYSGLNPTGMVFPSPPLVYQNQGRLRYDIYSGADQVALPQNIHLVFQGVQRMPCN